MKTIFRNIFLSGVLTAALFSAFTMGAAAADLKRDYTFLAQIPVLDQGRAKPLDTFARAYLKTFNSRDSVDGMSAIEWLAELICDPARAYKRQVFNIPNPQVVEALELERRERHRYSYNEVSSAITKHFMVWHALFIKPKEELTLEQNQLLTLYNKTQLYADIALSFSLVFPDFKVPAGVLSEILDVKPGERLAYMQVRRKENEIREAVSVIQSRAKNAPVSLSSEEKEIMDFVQKFDNYTGDKNTSTLRIIPSVWNDRPEKWFSPWGITEEGYGSPQAAELLRSWMDLIIAFRQGDNSRWNDESRKIYQGSVRLSSANASRSLLALECQFNRFQPFAKSFMLYLLGFVLVLASYLFWPKFLRNAAFGAVVLAFGIHTAGVLTRMIIMQRPPVTSLYESILFVSFIAVLFGIILELRRKNALGIIIAALIGAFLHFLGLRYDTDGDTMGMLVAVLNTNFWLSTHVVTITIGYGCCLVGGIMAHVYMAQRIFKPQEKAKTTELYNNLRGVSIVAMFFAVLGTILGGIWADQSWGRFWGWDPKENGALLIVLWLAWLIHGRISGKIGELGFVAGMICTNVVVALAWFGVNLLSVGLHSYGFTQNAALNLGVFCGVEILVAVGGYWFVRLRNK